MGDPWVCVADLAASLGVAAVDRDLEGAELDALASAIDRLGAELAELAEVLRAREPLALQRVIALARRLRTLRTPEAAQRPNEAGRA